MSNTIQGLHSNQEYYLDDYGDGTADYSDWDQAYENCAEGSCAQDQYLNEGQGPSTQGPAPSMDGIGDWDGAPEDPASETAEFKQQCQALLEIIQDSENLSPEQKQAYAEKLAKLQSSADLHPDSLDLYQGQLDELREGYELSSAHSPLANELAERYGQDPAAVEELAKKYGLDLKNLPRPADESVLKFLGELDPSLGEALQGTKKAVEDKLKKDAEMVQKAKDRNAMAVMSNKDMDDTDLSSYEYLLQAQTGVDPASLDMNEKITAFQGQVETALGALYGEGVSVEADLMAQAFELNVPRLPDEAPELVSMAWDGRGTKSGGNFDRMEWPAWVSEYPKIEYNGKEG